MLGQVRSPSVLQKPETIGNSQSRKPRQVDRARIETAVDYPKDLTQVPTLKLIAFLFLTFGQVTDNSLGQDELKVIAKRLANWVPAGSPVAIPSMLREVAGWHTSLESEDLRRMTASDSAHILYQRLSKEDRRKVVLDIVEIAKADGKVSDGERGFMSALLAIFKIKTSTNLDLQPRNE